MIMKNIVKVVIIIFWLSKSISSIAQFREAAISNKFIKAKLYLPDPQEGYYRGTRFDWAGQISSLESGGHSYFGKWFEKYDPLLHDAIMGPVDDFYPVGYDEAKVGETFLKIGIGTMVKPEETKYNFPQKYKIVNTGAWKVKKKKDHIDFTHKFSDEKNAYLYKKTVKLVDGKQEMEIFHTLINQGKTVIDTRVYNHNFFVMDNQITGPDFTVGLQFSAYPEKPSPQVTGEIQEKTIVFNKVFAKNDHLVYAPLLGYGNEAKDYDFRIENHKTGAAVRVTCDKPIIRLVFWSAEKTICPEPYIAIKIAPGESFSWKYNYEFYSCEKK